MPKTPNFSHQVGAHCSSTSVQNVLRFDGIELSEELAARVLGDIVAEETAVLTAIKELF